MKKADWTRGLKGAAIDALEANGIRAVATDSGHATVMVDRADWPKLRELNTRHGLRIGKVGATSRYVFLSGEKLLGRIAALRGETL